MSSIIADNRLTKETAFQRANLKLEGCVVKKQHKEQKKHLSKYFAIYK